MLKQAEQEIGLKSCFKSLNWGTFSYFSSAWVWGGVGGGRWKGEGWGRMNILEIFINH